MKTNTLEKPRRGLEKPIEARIIELEMELAEHKRAEGALRVSEICYRRLFEAAKDGVLLLDADTGQITDVNPYLIEKLGYSKEEFVSKKIWEIGAFKDTELSKAGFRELQEKGYVHYESMPLVTKDGRFFAVEFVSNIYLVEGTKVAQCNIRDITERKKAENALRESEEKLTEQNALLEQKNSALREIMNQNRDEKERITKQVQANVDHLLKPVVEKLKGKGSLLAERYTALLEANLKEITSSFGNDISSKMLSLTQKEIDICNMIKNGFSSKQISEALHISTRTIETHRNSIRKKLAISKKDVNLATYLKFLH
ncbi:MAG: PAS domain S-box protein [Chitinispirillaceae bacterium]|nr:PAS domain S-box protein [Chitinispirillaceae bacterium]